MQASSHYIQAGMGQLHYLQWGSGPQLLVAFHGYGENAVTYGELAAIAAPAYTVISVDLPYHGDSTWSDALTLKAKDLTAMVVKLMAMHHAERVTLVGYSLGGRVSLAIMQHIPDKIRELVLLAPDGLRIDPYYFFFTRTWLGKKIFRNLLSRPEPYFALMNALEKLRLVHHKRHTFALHFLHSAESRGQLLRVWPAMRRVLPSPAALKKIIARHKVPVVIFMGATDRIMPPALGAQFKKGLQTVQLHIIDKGHRVLDSDTAPLIAAALL